MGWVSVYDVSNIATAAPHWGATIIVAVIMGLPALGLLLLAHGARNKMLGAILLCGVAGTALVTLFGTDYYGRLRAELASGHFVVIDDQVTDAHVEHTGKHDAFVFRVIGDKFTLPDDFPTNCRLHNGDRVRIATEPETPQSQSADKLYPIMWLQMPEPGCPYRSDKQL